MQGGLTADAKFRKKGKDPRAKIGFGRHSPLLAMGVYDLFWSIESDGITRLSAIARIFFYGIYPSSRVFDNFLSAVPLMP